MTASAPSSAVLSALEQQMVQQADRITREALAAGSEHLAGIAPEAAALVDDLGTYLEGGKLLRPRLCFWGGVTALGREAHPDELDQLARCGAAIELVQAAALMHDDVIDHSPVRRGRPALHVQAAQRHRAASLRGDAEEFGIAVAIVLGDLALSWSEQLASEITGDADAVARARAEFDALRTEVMSGQYLDILHQAAGLGSVEDPEQAALAVIRWKTVPYSVLRPVRMGAALMGAEAPLLDALSAWSIEVGTAFQLRDDLLSVIGDQDSTGKPVGGDILEGKRTALLARTEQAADAAGRQLLERTVGQADADPEDILAVHELMRATGAVASVATDIRARASRAREILQGAGAIDGPGLAGLQRMADLATDVDALSA
ncbi:polyprenyl synthetase family protein [Brachybacterium sp. UMB0905]|uniref:polyprenyl synthetase family protein n=1 Tax=Brachybacterium sp. UMB0905 TaxID=2069310 RepID=UPI000C7F93D5|nr:polyprenyl synthetase family protein [Brachybacterium sp. UMB0905]PMC75770.1 geranylgeranyl pyrophosphate synthase [Brachybacterium sp. UMB0905]